MLLLSSGLTAASIVRAQASPQPVVEPEAEVRAEYHAVCARAVSAFEVGEFAAARELFLRANALWPSARTLRTLGMTAFELQMYARAVEELQSALDDERRPLSDSQQAQVAELLQQARGLVSREQPPPAEVSKDQQLSLKLDPLLLTPAPRPQRALSHLEAQVSTASPTLAPWLLLGGASAVAAAGGVLVGVALADKHQVEHANGESLAQLQPAHDRVPVLSTAGSLILGVGLAVAAVALGWGLLRDRESAPSKPARAEGDGTRVREAF